jgi:hypothetical protein
MFFLIFSDVARTVAGINPNAHSGRSRRGIEDVAMSTSNRISMAELSVYVLFAFLSLVCGAIVALFFVVSMAKLVETYPASSGVEEIVLAIALLWGVGTGCLVAVFTIGPWHRHRVRGQRPVFDDADDGRAIAASRSSFYRADEKAAGTGRHAPALTAR